MILDNVNPDDLFPTEKKGPSVLGMIEYNVQGQTKFEGAFIATNERLIMNVEINQIHCDGSDIIFEFNIGTVPMREIKTEDVQAFVDYIKQQIQ